MRSKVLAPVAAGVVLMAAGSAMADTKTTTFPVSAQVAATCLVSADSIDFGSYDGTSELAADGAVKVRCSYGTPFTVQLSAGAGTFAQRLLKSGANQLEYNLFTDSDFTSVWGDGTASTVDVDDVGAGLSSTREITHTVFGQLTNSAANQDAPAGPYSDTITVTVVY
jgi:spore coat protein U-like protein